MSAAASSTRRCITNDTDSAMCHTKPLPWLQTARSCLRWERKK